MAYLNNIKKDIQAYFVKRKKIKNRKTGDVSNLAKPESLVLFFSINSKKELDQIRMVVKHAEENVPNTVAYIFSNSYEKIDLITSKSLFYFDLHDFTLTGKKKEELQQRFNKDYFELAISFVTKTDSFSEILLADIRAGFKIGIESDERNKLFDLTINSGNDNIDFIDFYNHVFHYLSALNIKTVNFTS